MMHLDFETYSASDLRAVGAYRYAADPTTEVLILCYSRGTTVKTWTPHTQPQMPEELKQYAAGGNPFMAHNAQFERAIWQGVLVPRYGAPPTQPGQWHCTAARAAGAGLPRALDKAAAMLACKARKNPEGKALVKLFCMPRKPTKADARVRILPADAPEKFARFCVYCADDVKAEQELDTRLPPMTLPEQKLFALDFVVNERGIPLDMVLAKTAFKVVRVLEDDIGERVRRLTGGINPTQVEKMRHWFNDRGVPLPDLQAETIRRALPQVKDRVAANVLRMRIEAGKSSTKKLASMLRVAVRGRARGTILFNGAHTGRWSGKLIQPHNFIRGNLSVEEQARVLAVLAMGDPELMKMFWEWPIDAIAQCMRGFIMASPGMRLLVADYAAIEARVLCWLAGEEAILRAFARGLDVYKIMAARLFGVRVEDVTKEQRRIGKNLELGCGFGLGHVKFVDYCDKAGVFIDEDFSKEAVGVYRESHENVVAYWRTVQRAFLHAARTHKECTLDHNIKFGWEKGWVYIQLPSGRRLWYWDVKVKVYEVELKGGYIQQRTEISYDGGDNFREKLYGGKIVENIVQGTARDVMANGMYNAERAGYPVISTVHDEVLAERALGQGTLEEYVATLCRFPAWVAGCPITAEGFETLRYRKD